MNPGMNGFPVGSGNLNGTAFPYQVYQQLFTASGIWYPPAGSSATWFAALIVAGGGGGGGANNNIPAGGGGGGGFITVEGPIPTVPVTVTIGAGGSAGTNSVSGGDGGSTTLTGGFNGIVRGGQGGALDISSASNFTLLDTWAASRGGNGGINAGCGGVGYQSTGTNTAYTGYAGIGNGQPAFGYGISPTPTIFFATATYNQIIWSNYGSGLYSPLKLYNTSLVVGGLGGSGGNALTFGGGGGGSFGAGAVGQTGVGIAAAANTGGGGSGGYGNGAGGGIGGSGIAYIWWF